MSIQFYFVFILFLTSTNVLYAQSLTKKIEAIKIEFREDEKEEALRNKYSSSTYSPLLTVYFDTLVREKERYPACLPEIKALQPGEILVCNADKKNHTIEFYKALKIDTFTRIETRHIFLRYDNDSIAKIVLEKLNKGASFEELALQHSHDGSRTSGGYLGFSYEGEFVEEFVNAVVANPVGVPFIVQSRYGYHVTESLSLPVEVVGIEISQLIYNHQHPYITRSVVKKVCTCLKKAKDKKNDLDFEKMKTCMGNKNKAEFIADLLGVEATEEELKEAERFLDKAIREQCPLGN